MKEGIQPPVKTNWLNFNKRVYVILVCFFISIVFWLLLALSHEYSTTITFPVHYVNIPGRKVIMNELPQSIGVQLRTTGFKILSFGLNREQDPVEVDVSERFNNTLLTSEVLAVPTGFFLKDFSRELGKEVTITGFRPDSVVFNFSDLITRKLPVLPNVTASFEKQYDTVGAISVKPQVVEVSGPPSVVEKLKSIRTVPLKLENLKATFRQKVKLESNRFLTFHTNEVELTVPVEKYTEGVAEIDIKPINVTEGYTLKTFPDKVKVRYLVAISNYNKVDPSMFDAVVDGSDIQSKRTSKLEIHVITSPAFVRITLLEPEKVDYILRRQ